jgi:hypothetical protein
MTIHEHVMPFKTECTVRKMRHTVVLVRLCTNLTENVRFEVSTAVTMKNAVFWDVTPCGSCKNLRFGVMYRLRYQGDKNYCHSDNRGDTFLRNFVSYKSHTA